MITKILRGDRDDPKNVNAKMKVCIKKTKIKTKTRAKISKFKTKMILDRWSWLGITMI